MSQDRLNGLVMVSIMNDVLDRISCEDLMGEFCRLSQRRKQQQEGGGG